MVMVILSTSVERFSVSRMRNFFSSLSKSLNWSDEYIHPGWCERVRKYKYRLLSNKMLVHHRSKNLPDANQPIFIAVTFEQILKQTEKNINRQKQKETGRNGQKHTETGRKGPVGKGKKDLEKKFKARRQTHGHSDRRTGGHRNLYTLYPSKIRERGLYF